MAAVCCLLAGVDARALRAERMPSEALTEQGRTTHLCRLKNVPVMDVVSTVEDYLRSQREAPCGETCETAPELILVPDKVRNLVVVSGQMEDVRVIEDLIRVLDEPPRMIRAPCKLIEIGPDGKQSVLSRPVIMTLDGQSAVITVGERVPVGAPELETGHVQAGYSLSLKVHLLEGDTARLVASTDRQHIEESPGDGIRVVKKSVEIARTVRIGRPLKLVVDKADDGSPRSWWELTLTEVEPSAPDRGHPSPPKIAGRDKPQTNAGRHTRVDPGLRR